MKYYKDNQNNVYAYVLDGSQDYLIGNKVAMTDEEVEAHINPKPTPEQLKQQRIAELKTLLSESDYKESPSYMASKTDAENKAIFEQRTAWREEVRGLVK